MAHRRVEPLRCSSVNFCCSPCRRITCTNCLASCAAACRSAARASCACSSCTSASAHAAERSSADWRPDEGLEAAKILRDGAIYGLCCVAMVMVMQYNPRAKEYTELAKSTRMPHRLLQRN